MTSLGDEVFVVRWSSQQVEVYDVITLKQKKTLSVPGLGSQVYCGLAACDVNKCLYISDCDNNVVHRVELARNNIVTKWSVSKGPEGLSVNSSHNVLVAGNGTHKIEEYTTHGTLVRQISLQSEIQYPKHVVQLSSDQFGVTHQGPNHGYSVVDVNGQVIKTYGHSYGSGPRQMNQPYGIAINSRDFGFIADTNNNRIIVINPRTFNSRQLSVSVDGGLQSPMCLLLDESRDRLYIGEWSGRRVLVVNCVRNINFN